MMANRKGKFKVKNGSGSYDQVMLETQLGQVVDSPIKSVERSTRYEQNDVVAEQTCKGTLQPHRPLPGIPVCQKAVL